MTILMNKGDGSGAFTVTQTSFKNPVGYILRFPVRDFDGDGIPDLALVENQTTYSQSASAISFAKGFGDGGFAEPVAYPLPVGAAYSVAAGQFRDGGGLDLAAPNFLDDNLS